MPDGGEPKCAKEWHNVLLCYYHYYSTLMSATLEKPSSAFGSIAFYCPNSPAFPSHLPLLLLSLLPLVYFSQILLVGDFPLSARSRGSPNLVAAATFVALATNITSTQPLEPSTNLLVTIVVSHSLHQAEKSKEERLAACLESNGNTQRHESFVLPLQSADTCKICSMRLSLGS